MNKSKSLVPVEGDTEGLDEILSVMSKSGSSLRTVLDSDSCALCRGDMRYFSEDWYGRVPTYSRFMGALSRLGGDAKDDFMERVAEIEGSRYEGEMERTAALSEYTAHDRTRFGFYKQLQTIQERRLNRIDARRKARGEGAKQGMDLAIRLISAMSNGELLRVKGDLEAIESEVGEGVYVGKR